MSLLWARPMLAAAFGAVFALASPPTDLYPSLWIGMAGLAFILGAARRTPPQVGKVGSRRARVARVVRRALEGSACGLGFGIGANVVALRFVPGVIARFTPLPFAVGVVALVLLAAFEALRWAIAAMVCQSAVRLGVPRCLAFAIGVFAGTFVMTVFPWSAAGGVTPWPAMIQLADVVGERGVTFVMALSAGLLASGVALARGPETPRRAVVAVLAAVLLPLATLAHGAMRIGQVEASREAAPRARVALIQPSIDALDRWNPAAAVGILRKLNGLTHAAEQQGAELTIWPEAAYPYPLDHAARRAPVGSRAVLQSGVHGPVLFGLVTQDASEASYNSAAIVTADGALSEPQDKVHLLWFGETVPFADRFRWIRETFARGVGLAPGDRTVALVSGNVRAAVLNCFEDTLPDAARGAMATDPNLLVNITNDAWFAGSGESTLHLRLAALRAVELRRDLVRAVNYGPTSWVDAAGIVRAASGETGPLMTEPALLDTPPTPYAKVGDLPLAAMGLAVALAALWRRRRA